MFYIFLKCHFAFFRVLDLEAALLEPCSSTTVYNICKGKAFPESVRPEAWEACLGIQDKPDQLAYFNEIYDLPEQEELRQDCQNVVEKLGNDDYDKVSVVSDIESILTYYCKCKNLKYDKTNGFIELLLPILALKTPKSKTYNIFEAIINQYLPRNSTNDISSLFRLLILYHDPELCSFLDTKRVTPDLYVNKWFKTLFSGTCYLKVVQSIWDFYFQQSDPFFVFFLSLVIVVNGKEHLMKMRNDDKNKIVEAISAMPSALEHDDVTDFCSLAQYYALKTPISFKKVSVLYFVLRVALAINKRLFFFFVFRNCSRLFSDVKQARFQKALYLKRCASRFPLANLSKMLRKRNS